MRQVVLDTETTGLEPESGHRIIEIGCVELINRRPTDRTYHQYIFPERESDEGALQVHGITNEFLKDKPLFREIASDLIEFVRGADVIIHNAPFDIAFLDLELQMLGSEWGKFTDYCSVLDSLELAREMHPGQRNSLDALCRRYEVDNSQRTLHGALLDAGILADVYLAMTGGQTSLGLDAGESRRRSAKSVAVDTPVVPRRLRVIMPSAMELEAHERCLDAIDRISGGNCRWQPPSGDEQDD